MLGFKYFICSLFLGLSVGAPQDFSGVLTTIDSQGEITTSSINNDHQALIVDGCLRTNQANWSFKIVKIPFIPGNDKVSLPTAETYDYKLLYLEIGKTIPLKLTSSKLIFPFHCFT
ncbi:hypothetical protein [Flavobacterium orientale]|uniref:Uncharacterized protein n=1 Tax=Flavobacterium orientale TaxID=1756020 RepID=A0A917DE14_9FLAO|nr:hypothetical protein [Flavobacterium orientale]GGD30668.1 hypothetical protein GCM10011343_21040 [Flavobacterium orientale]